jgi:outer membrane protein TolC
MTRRLGLVLTGLLLPPQVHGVTLTWEECVKEAAANNPDIAAAEAGVKNADALVLGSYTGFLPQLSASVGVTRNGSNGGVPGTTTFTTGVSGSQTTYSESLQLNQNLFNGFSDVGKVKQAQANREVAKAQLAAAKATLSAGLKTAFAELLFEEKAVDLNQTILERQKKNLRMVTLRYEGGQENKGSQLYQAASVAQTQYQYEHAGRQVRNGSRQLAALLGRPDNGELRVEGEFTTQAPAGPPDFQKIVQSHPGHIQAYQQERSADANVEINNGNWYPDLNLTGAVGKTGPSYPPDTDRWSVGLTLVFPFFPGTSTIAGVDSAHALKHQAEFQLTSADLKLEAGLEQAYEALLDAIGQVTVADDFYVAAKSRSTIADGKYNTGLMTFEDWSVIDADYTTRQQTLLLNQRNAKQAEANWESAEGIGDIR